MSGLADKRSSIERRLLEEPRRTVGLDGSGEPVRLGERDAGGHVVGYIDPDGLAWESLIEGIVAVHGQRLAEALALGYDDPRRDPLMDHVLAEVPDRAARRRRRRSCLPPLAETSATPLGHRSIEMMFRMAARTRRPCGGKPPARASPLQRAMIRRRLRAPRCRWRPEPFRPESHEHQRSETAPPTE